MTTALLLIDAQRNMLEGPDSVPSASSIRRVLEGLLHSARHSRAVIVHVQNDGGSGDPDEPMTFGWELVFPPAEGETVVRKDRCDVFESDSDLASVLKSKGVDRVVVAGMQSEFCIEESSLGALREGFEVVVPREAHTTYDEEQKTAREVSGAVERKLEAAGVSVVGIEAVDFA
ncbi:MAG: isochorismatase family protein [Acidimicrobiales bacterium]